MLDIGTALRHYKRREVQQAMVMAAAGREVAVRFGERGFGKRPDALVYPNDVLEFAKQGATSFHVSEEHWENVSLLAPSMKKEELDRIRTGWDLVLDVDCPDWRLSKIISWLIIMSLKEHGIRSISAKFSGNKGFHIGVPKEAFPATIHGKETRTHFPDGPKRIASYLIDYISRKHVTTEGRVVFGKKYAFTVEDLSRISGRTDLFETVCTGCGARRTIAGAQAESVCSRCGFVGSGISCPKCSMIMDKVSLSPVCACGESRTAERFNPAKVIDLDTMLISSRHMYRMAYSLHEKSGLVSLPLDPGEILQFRKSAAEPDSLRRSPFVFLDNSSAAQSEAGRLILMAFDHRAATNASNETEKKFASVEGEVPAQLFPPCIKRILAGLEDGKKRALFILINFLSQTGYGHDRMEELLTEWNHRNREPLREVLIKGQLRYRKNSSALPPNCDNEAYYRALGVCLPDSFCPRIRNPVNYALLKARMLARRPRQKLTEEQKEMRRKHRERSAKSAAPGPGKTI